MDDAIPRSIWIVLLIAAGGLFSGAETAFSFSNTVRMRMIADEGSSRAKKAVKIAEDYDMAIVTLLIVINIVHILCSTLATSLFIDLMHDTAAGSAAATAVTTLAIFIFSETVPKNFAKTNADSYALAVSPVIRFFMYLLYPVDFLLTALGSGVKKLFRLNDDQPSVTEDEFAIMVEDAADEDVFEPEESEIIRSAIEFGDTTVGEIMTPRENVVAISVKETEEEIKRILIGEKYSRFPVYRGSLNNIVGVVRTTNALWNIINSEDGGFDLRELMTKPLFCSPEDAISDLFERMCNRKNHFAVVRDEDEKTAGIVTMEDILEEIVGEIYDEDDSVSETEVGEHD